MNNKNLSEDIWALIIGSGLIVVVLLLAFIFPDLTFLTPSYSWSTAPELASKLISTQNITLFVILFVLYALLSRSTISGHGWIYSKGFAILFLLAILSLFLAGNKRMNSWGLEYVVFALLLGLVLNHSGIGKPWIQSIARSEFFIKTGLILLGSSVLFTEIIKAGIPGILQAVVVVLVVWFFAMWLSKKMKLDDEMGVILASAVSICGVSAAIVASGVIEGDKKKLSYITTMVLLMAIPMLILQPWIIKTFGIPEMVGGAWLGGTLDTTASVTAASEIVGPIATKIGVIVKFSQNVLIGVAAVFIAAWWSYRHKKTNSSPTTSRLSMIWDRFPKFVVGFIAASLLFSFLIPTDTTKQVSGFLNAMRTVWFSMAFVAIGLEADFREIMRLDNGRPALVFIGAQLFNIAWTLLWAYLLFGGILMNAPSLQ